MKLRTILISSLGIAAFAAAVLLSFVIWKPSAILVSHDLDSDGTEEKIGLKEQRMDISKSGEVIWSSPKDWRVTAFAIGDSDNDGSVEINLSVWKTGSYGKFKPFWMVGEDVSKKNHLFIMRLQPDGRMKYTWQSSNLDKPICALEIRDFEDDGKNEIVVSEGDYGQRDACSSERQSVWRWRMWNFFRVDD